LGQSWRFWVGAFLAYLVVQVLFWLGDAEVPVFGTIFTTYIQDVIKQVGILSMVALGLNLIYGFNGQFSLGQWGFYAIGAYAAADLTYRWSKLHTADGVTVLLMVVLFVGLAMWGLGRLLSRVRGLDILSAFGLYLVVVIAAAYLGVRVGGMLAEPATGLLNALPPKLASQIVFFVAVLLGGLVAAEVAYLFGLPVLTLGSDYFGIATLGFTIIVKVLLDNSDTMFGFEEMKGARGMIGIPRETTWFWVFLFLLVVVVVTRNLLHSSEGRALVSVREDEIAAKAMGIDVARYKNLAFVIGSLFAGLAGALYAHINGFLHPDNFNFLRSFDPMIIIVFGGLGSVTGTIVASFGWAILLEGVLRLFLPAGFETWRFVVYPLLLLIMMLLRPSGLLGTFELPFLKKVPPPLKATNPAAREATGGPA
ncbi:MAG: branched-chain amino acid ABC transporter permease, partial [Chloroflexi bacterium]|nr:branched-chain amino acid ABC transporter permease [Chloroflexota bacterium]